MIPYRFPTIRAASEPNPFPLCSTTTEMQKQATLATKVTTFMVNLSKQHGEKKAAKEFLKTLKSLHYIQKEITSLLKREKGTQTK